ncbi:hypothetical protein RhiirC2_242771 [Rhizophagus irregularis]|uniref:Uncharacterized protein n=1 Tax=Rhizophagus irregularis TaxID=588596 RepID=A0A2N1MG95_9GLOM|nr:hypothetical protein RhiirC2_242771 [Rhizophagus irregularis]
MVRYRDLLSLTENHTLSWIDLYNQHLVEINDDPDELIGPAVDNVQEVDGNDSDEEDDDAPQEAYELRTDWMLLAEMMPNRQTRSLDDFSARDIDRITTGLTKVCYDIMKERFIQQAIGNN